MPQVEKNFNRQQALRQRSGGLEMSGKWFCLCCIAIFLCPTNPRRKGSVHFARLLMAITKYIWQLVA